jgi:hypothetical protein
MVDNRIVTRPGLKDVDAPFAPYRDMDATEKHVQWILKDGTPNWVKWPADYKAMAQEDILWHEENSRTMAADYEMEDQVELTNRKARMVNPMGTRDFIAKLRAHGIKCFTVDNGHKGTVALWCLPPHLLSRARYICFLQIPAMWEWSVLNVDRYGKPLGEAFRGWRTACVQLVEKEILTEAEMNKIFGNASGGKVFRRYHRSLWELRNRKKFSDKHVSANDI